MHRHATNARAVGVGAAYTIQGNPWPYVAPGLGAVLNLILAAVLHFVWGAGARHITVWAAAWRSALVMSLCVALVAATWAAGRARQTVLRAGSLGMSAASSLGLWVLTFHAWTVDLVIAYLLLMFVGSVNLVVIKVLRGDGTDARPAAFGKLADRVEELKRVAELGPGKIIDGVVTARFKMEPGVEAAELAKPSVRGAIATVVPTAKGNVQVHPDPNRPGEGTLEIAAVDHLAEPPAWPGLSAPGGCISEPIRLCVYRTGRPVPIYLPGDVKLNRNAIGLLVIAGQPGSGKTELVLRLIAEIRSRHNTDLTIIDIRKGAQLPRWVRDSVPVICDQRPAEKLIGGLMAEVSARAAQLGREGLKEWTPASKLRFKVVIIDEAAQLIATRNEQQMIDLAESVRSVGICLVLVQQRVTADRMPASVKKARGGSICLGMADDKEAGRILAEATMEAGASPGSWKNNMPGCLYAELPGIPERDWSTPARTYRPGDDAELPTAMAPYIGSAVSPAATTPAAAPAPLDEQDEDDMETDETTTEDVLDDEVLDLADDDPEARPEPADPDAGDPREPIDRTAGVRFEFGEDIGDHRWTKPELLLAIRHAIVQLHDRGVDRIRPADLSAVQDFVGPDNLKPPRMSAYLAELCEPGPDRLLRRDGNTHWYTIDPDPACQARELTPVG